MRLDSSRSIIRPHQGYGQEEEEGFEEDEDYREMDLDGFEKYKGEDDIKGGGGGGVLSVQGSRVSNASGVNGEGERVKVSKKVGKLKPLTRQRTAIPPFHNHLSRSL